MKQQEVFKKIGVIIQEINEQYEYLQGTAENLNDLELELFVANTHFLKDHAEILRKLNAIKGQPITKTNISDEPKWFEPVVQPAKSAPVPSKPEPAKSQVNDSINYEIADGVTPDTEPEAAIDLSSSAPADSYSFEREEPEIIRHELLPDEANTFDEENEALSADEALLTPVAEIDTQDEGTDTAPEEEVVTNSVTAYETDEKTTPAPEFIDDPESGEEPVSEPLSPEPVRAKSKKPVAESMEAIQVDNLKSTAKEEKVIEPLAAADEEDKVLTLNQRLSAQRKEYIAKPTEVIEPLADIKTAINLNDKLLFVKDLFKGYNLAYTEAIEIVNRFTSFEEADRFLKNNYVTKNNWEGKKETSDKFYALLRRRYA